MTYLLGWTLVLIIAVGVALLLRKVGPPGGAGNAPPRVSGSCCNVPPAAPAGPPARPRPRRPDPGHH